MTRLMWRMIESAQGTRVQKKTFPALCGGWGWVTFAIFGAALLCAGCQAERPPVAMGFEEFRAAAADASDIGELAPWLDPSAMPGPAAPQGGMGALYLAKSISDRPVRVLASYEDGDTGVVVAEVAGSGDFSTGQAMSVLMTLSDRWRLLGISRPAGVVPELWADTARPEGTASATVSGSQGAWEAHHADGILDARSESLEVILRESRRSQKLFNELRVGGRSMGGSHGVVITFQNAGSAFKLGEGPINSMCLNMPGPTPRELVTHCRSLPEGAFTVHGDPYKNDARVAGSVGNPWPDVLGDSLRIDAPVYVVTRF